ncbi:SusC/RagA family TonB-linked outer membrane protein [Pedobacter vanadiisoli]|uniref:SusC/RagA family TonB-linked outer membrane protein n=1 Tax=Pedobacter vanadiisoli TaxID=1761975 RepID=A0ABW5ML30_9SPHI
MEKNSTRHAYVKFLTATLFYLLIPWLAFAQKTIRGTVLDPSNKPLPGVSIIEKGTKNGTATNADGKFSLTVQKDGAVIVARIVGYRSAEKTVSASGTVNFSLEEDNNTLNEVVTIGYQKITRKKTTAAISSISSKELANLPSASFDQLLQGRVSGVNVQNFTGQPGAAPTVSVRGNSLVSRGYDEFNVINSPLYVVDGVPQPTETYVGSGVGTGQNYLAGINPTDIESIDVLKDASAAAIYGSRAANGVILITTKKGLSGEPRVSINTYAGLTQRPKLRDVTLGTTERRQKMDILQRQLSYNDLKQLPYILTDSLNPAYNGNTDWQDLFYQSGKITNGDLSVSGGGANGMVYRFSGGYYDEQGIIKATGFKRYSGRLNLTTRAMKEKLMINPIIAYSRSDFSRGNGNGSSPINLGAGNMPSSLLNLDEDKKALLLGAYDESLDKNISNQLTLNLNLSYEFNKHLMFTSQSSYLLNTARRDYSRTSILNNGQGNSSSSYADNGTNALTSNFLSYNNQFGKHSVSVIAGQDIQYNQFQNTSASGYGGPSDNIQVVNGFQQSRISAGSDYQAYGLLSYYGRLAYDFNGKYLLSASARADGSSRFGKNNKWGYFPSASVGWLISEENFIKNWVNNPFTLIKLRASLGTSGSLPNNNYLQYNLYSVNNGGFNGNGGATSYNGTTAITPNLSDGAAQSNLSWEKSLQWNIGTDMEIKNGKYALSFDVYNKESSLQLFSVNLPLTTGYDRALTNSIGVRNSGAELTVSATPIEGNFKWFTRVNASYNKNQIMNLPNGGRDLILSGDRFDKSHILSVGSPINAFYLYRTNGVFSRTSDIPVNPFTGELYRNSNGTYQAGQFYLADLDGDGFIDIFNDGINPDKAPIGDPNPKITGGWTNDFSYKNFSLNIFCTFTFDRDVLNLFESDRFSNSTDGDPINRFAAFSTPDLSKINIWRNPGDQAEYAKYDLGSYRYYYTGAQTFFLEKGGYFRIRSINFGYNFPAKTLKKLGLNKLKLFAIADNVYMFQQSKRLPDAENVNPYGEYNGAGYPIPRKYTLGLEIQF